MDRKREGGKRAAGQPEPSGFDWGRDKRQADRKGTGIVTVPGTSTRRGRLLVFNSIFYIGVRGLCLVSFQLDPLLHEYLYPLNFPCTPYLQQIPQILHRTLYVIPVYHTQFRDSLVTSGVPPPLRWGTFWLRWHLLRPVFLSLFLGVWTSNKTRIICIQKSRMPSLN